MISKPAVLFPAHIFLFILLFSSVEHSASAQASTIGVTVCTQDKDQGTPLGGVDVVMQMGSQQPVSGTTDTDGCTDISLDAGTSTAVDGVPGVPAAFKVDAPYPNPVVNEVSFPVSLKQTQQVTFEIFDVTGRSVLPMHRSTLSSGEHRFDMELGGLVPGLYLYRIEGGEGVATGKFVKVSGGSNITPRIQLDATGDAAMGSASIAGSSVSASSSFTVRVDATHQQYLSIRSAMEVADGATVVLDMEKLAPGVPSAQSFSNELSPGYDCDTGDPAPVSEYTIDLSSLSGSYAANALSPYFLNSSGSIISNTKWTSESTNYLKGDDYTYLSTQSRYCSRDMEIDTWARDGIVFLRLTPAGKAIYFFVNGETTNGSIEIGYVTDLTEGVSYRYSNSGNFYPVYSNANLVNTVPRYTKSDTDGDQFTFGVEGFDMYAKYNGMEFFRWTDYRHIEEGRIATQANNGYGFRDITARNFSDIPLYSDYASNTIDLRDFGLKGTRSTGSIDAGSTQLQLSEVSDFNVGDFVIVEIGGESGKGLRGSVGVGGTWPALSYQDASQMNADASQQVDQYAWVEDTQDVYSWDGTSWNAVNSYYTEKAIPRALEARIVNISSDGKVLTLDKPAATSASDAGVHFNNWYVIQRIFRSASYDGAMNWPPDYTPEDEFKNLILLTPDNLTVYIPEGDYAIGREYLELRDHTGWHIQGAGKDNTRIFSPEGTPSAEIRLTFAPESMVSNLHLEGNARDNGFMLSGNSQFFSETYVAQGLAYPYGVLMSQGSHGSVARDLKVTDVFQKAVGTSYCNDCWAYNIENYMTEGLRIYIQQMFKWADSVGGGCVDCSVTSNTLIRGFEAFKSEDIQFIRPVGVNAIISMNAAGDFLIEDADITITPMSQAPDRAVSEQEPIVNINSNIDHEHPYLALGGTIRNINIVQEGYINEDNDLLRGIVVNINNPDILVEGGHIQGPDWAAPSALPGANGVTSTGQNTVVDGLTVNGTVNENNYPGANIAVLTSGAIRNCVADMVKVTGTAVVENCVPTGGETLTAQLTANATSVYAGDMVLLTWSSTAADRCDGTNFATGGDISGEAEVAVFGDIDFTVTCTNTAESVSQTVSIQTITSDNQLPVADAGVDITVTDDDGDGYETVLLDGSKSYDPDGTIVSYDWYEDSALVANGSTASIVFSQGSHTISLVVTDDKGDSKTDDVVITVDSPTITSIQLAASGSKVKGNVIVDLSWSGASTATVDLYRDGVLIGSMENTGAYTDDAGRVAGDTVVYKICETAGSGCSADVSVATSSGGGKGKNT